MRMTLDRKNIFVIAAALITVFFSNCPAVAQGGSFCAPPPSGLASWWAGEGTASDSEGTNNGALFNGATFAPGKVGHAFSFDGVNGYIEIPDSPSLSITNTLSIDAWFWPR